MKASLTEMFLFWLLTVWKT